VLIHAAPDDEGDSSIRFISGGIHAANIEALEAAAGKNVMVIGTNVARQCVQEKWKRNSHASSVCFVWGGMQFFNWPGARDEICLETMDVTPWGN
jgi:hypothetical protein